MKFGELVFRGSNYDQDALWALSEVLGQEALPLWHKDPDLKGVDAIVVPGGFSYGDYLRCGAMARFSPVMQSVQSFAEAGGPVVGICNGFQILCEAGLLPGALVRNEGLKFVCRPQPIRVERTVSKLLDADRGEILVIPVKHGDGRYVASAELLRLLVAEGQVVFRYCDAQGRSTDDANPNGATGGIAGVCNEAGNVLGMMPHPEHAVDASVGFHSADGAAVIGGLLKRAVRA